MLKKINDSVVKKIKLDNDIDYDSFRGIELIYPYTNTFICAKKHSGKTTVINHLLKNTIDENTKVYIFCSTVYNDNSYRAIVEWFKKKNIEHHLFTSIIENKIDYLKLIVDKLVLEAEQKQTEININQDDEKDDLSNLPYGVGVIVDIDQDENIKVKIPKKKKLTPEIVFIFDDMSSQLRNSASLSVLLKQNRHYKSNVYISSQNVNDLYPDQRLQIQNWYIFKGFSYDKIIQIYNSADPSIDIDKFYEIYLTATEEPYNFFNYNTVKDIYRKNFNYQFII